MKLESAVARHPKMLRAGPAAAWLWVCGLAYCQEGLTDGHIPTEAIDHLGVRGAGRYAAVLVAVGLWEPVPDGWRVHDYHAHNRTAQEVSDLRAVRQRSGVAGGRASWEHRAEAKQKQHAEARSEQDTEAHAKQHAEAHENRVLNPDQISTDQISTDQIRSAVRTDSSATSAEPPAAVLEFPVIGNPSRPTWALSQAQIDEWAVAFPGMDILGHCRRARAWLLANRKKKTARGMPRFLNSWLAREVDRPAPAQRGPRQQLDTPDVSIYDREVIS